MEDFRSSRSVGYAQIYEQLQREGEHGKKARQIPGSIRFTFESISDIPRGLVNPSLKFLGKSTLNKVRIEEEASEKEGNTDRSGSR